VDQGTTLPYAGTATPITCDAGGRPFVVDIAFALPEGGT